MKLAAINVTIKTYGLDIHFQLRRVQFKVYTCIGIFTVDIISLHNLELQPIIEA